MIIMPASRENSKPNMQDLEKNQICRQAGNYFVGKENEFSSIDSSTVDRFLNYNGEHPVAIK